MIRPPRARHGFTLIEMMLVVTLIGVLAALIGPGVAEVIADNRAAGAAEDLVRLQRIVRARVMETGLAHLVEFDPSADNNLGAITVWEGMNNHCATTPWASAIASTGAANGHYPVEQIRMATYNPSPAVPKADDSDRQVIRLTAKRKPLSGSNFVAVTGTLELCYQPNGLAFEASSSWVFTPHRETVMFEVTRTVNAVQHGPIRQVIYPPGGNARHVI